MIKKIITSIFIFVCFLIILVIVPTVFAQTEGGNDAQIANQQEERLEGVVKIISEEKQIQVMNQSQLYQKLEIEVTTGSLKGQTVTVENGNLPTSNVVHYALGDEVVLSYSKSPDGQRLVMITDFVRRGSLLWLFIIFVVITVLIGRLKGLTSIIGMVVSFAVIFMFILPQILSGHDPVFMTILGSLVIIPVSFYLSHGLNRKTTVAIFGTLISLIITGILANFFVEAGKLSGFVSEESGFLQEAFGNLVNIKGLMLSGIIIGVLGILDDVTISQSAMVREMKVLNPKMSAGELYRSAMIVGRDHIASMVNTLVLVYAGASMPLLLLFISSTHSFSEVINYEIIANEIIRTLVGSIGLVLTVPLTTLIAAFGRKEPN